MCPLNKMIAFPDLQSFSCSLAVISGSLLPQTPAYTASVQTVPGAESCEFDFVNSNLQPFFGQIGF